MFAHNFMPSCRGPVVEDGSGVVGQGAWSHHHAAEEVSLLLGEMKAAGKANSLART